MATTMRDLIHREREQLAAKKARRNALNDGLAQLGRLRSDGVERAISVRADLAAVDADIARHEARLRLMRKEQELDERTDRLSHEGAILVPDPGSSEYPAYRERLAKADILRRNLEQEREDLAQQWEELL